MAVMSTMNLDATSSSGSAKALVKGIALVELVVAATAPMRQSDLVGASGLPRGTAVRLLDVLCEQDILRLNAGGRYELGPRVATWGQAFLRGLDLDRIAFDLLEHLVELSDETCFLGVRDRTSILYLAAVNSPQPVRPAARIGSRNPLHSTGIGKTLLAFGTREVLEQVLAGPLPARTANTITDPEALRADLQRIRDRGFAIDDVENEEGVRCVAAPVRDHLGETVAAISVSAPAYRFSLEDVIELAPSVVATADEISRRLGHRPDPALATAGARPDPTTAPTPTAEDLP